jgi:hypothetical protein
VKDVTQGSNVFKHFGFNFIFISSVTKLCHNQDIFLHVAVESTS